jgi:hypothetical protein
MTPSVNVFYDDVWTDAAAAGRAPDASFAYSYADTTFTTPPPTAAQCVGEWSSTCRITINYRQHIQPLWDKVRQIIDPMNGNVLEDNTCSRAGCHNITDANNMTQVPASQLDLRNVDSTDEPDHVVGYRELLFTDNEQELNMGQLVDRLVPGPIDPVTGLPILVPVPVAPSMAPQNARGSTRFFSRFAAGGTHAGRLSPAELRLVSEWLDIGAQYFNNPFDPAAPVN